MFHMIHLTEHIVSSKMINLEVLIPQNNVRSFLLVPVSNSFGYDGDENLGRSTLIRMKAGNLLWDEKGGIKAIRWYSNKNIINPPVWLGLKFGA